MEEYTKLLAMYQSLCPDMQKAFCWICENFAILYSMAKEAPIPEDKRKKLLEEAEKKGDVSAMALLYFVQVVNENPPLDKVQLKKGL